MINEIDELIINEFKGDNFLLELSKLIQKYKENKVLIGNEEYLFSKENEKVTQRFISFCFLRCIANINYQKIETSRHKVLKFISENTPELCGIIGINDKLETFKKISQIQDFVKERENSFKYDLFFSGNINELTSFQQEFRRFVNNKKNFLLIEFCPGLIDKNKLDALFNALNTFINSVEDEKYQQYKTCESIISSYLKKCKEVGTYYSLNVFYPIFEKILTGIKIEIEKSPFFLPAHLSVKSTEKKYPFSINSKNSISLVIFNNADGYATNVNLKILSYEYDKLIIEESEKFIGNLRRNEVIVDFVYTVISEILETQLKVEITWTTNNRTESEIKTIELKAQKSGINWDEILFLKPYNLEPVESNRELVGRSTILNTLNNMHSSPLGSAYIYGQRRVGKTSIVKTLQNVIEDKNLQVIYIEGGDWNDATDAHRSMENLGLKICRKIKKFHQKFSSLEIPLFSGSFNRISDFLDDVSEIDKNYKLLIILDEFDRISSSLYERGDVGKSFVLSIRSISNRPNFGFILVGGEKMEYILSQWQEFNKFSPIRVDYFSKEHDWEDFRQLIKKPVDGVLDISDKAISKIFEETNGNPYFTKKICMELYNIMMSYRDIHVTEREAIEAIEFARNSSKIGATDFSHFWEDGIKGKVEKEEEVSLMRRKVLILLAQLLINKNKIDKNTIRDKGLEVGLQSNEIDKYLLEFEQRKILFFRDEEAIFIVNFFKEWLINGGKEKIIATFEEEERVSILKKLEEELMVKPHEINEVTSKLSLYKGKKITNETVRNWLNQFEEVEHQRLVFKLFQNFKLYSEEDLRNHSGKLFRQILRELNKRGNIRTIDNSKRKRDDFLLTYLDNSPSKGGAYLAKLFSDENNIYSDLVVSPDQIERKITEKNNIKAIIIVDDLIGTGKTLSENFAIYFEETLLELIKSKNISIFIVTITGFAEAKDVLLSIYSNIGLELYISDLLNNQDRSFDINSQIFDKPINSKKAKDICTIKGELIEPKAPLGFGDCQLLIAFPMNCPNNTLPIFWKKTESWIPLFERS